MSPLARIADLARTLGEQFLQPRRILLKHRAPKSPEVHQLERNLAANRVKPIEMLLRMDFAKVEDGIAPTTATAWVDSYKAIVAEHAAEVHAGRPGVVLRPDVIVAANLRETTAEGILNFAQLGLQADLGNLDKIDATLAAGDNYVAVWLSDVAPKLRAYRARLTLDRTRLTA